MTTSSPSTSRPRPTPSTRWRQPSPKPRAELAEAVETAQEVSGHEPDEDEKVTAAVIKKALKALIDDLKDSAGASGKKELKKPHGPGQSHQ